LALRAARNFLVFAAGGGHLNIHDISLEKIHPVCFNQGVNRKGRSILTLAPATVAAVNNEWLRFHSVAYMAAGAAAVVKVFLI
jgi:hypothetical protein